MNNKTFLEIKLRDLQSYINTGFDQDIKAITAWETSELNNARVLYQQKLSDLNQKLAEQLGDVRKKLQDCPENKKEKLQQQEVFIKKALEAEKTETEKSYMAKKIQIREEAYIKRMKAESKLANAKNEADIVSNQIANLK